MYHFKVFMPSNIKRQEAPCLPLLKSNSLVVKLFRTRACTSQDRLEAGFHQWKEKLQKLALLSANLLQLPYYRTKKWSPFSEPPPERKDHLPDDSWQSLGLFVIKQEVNTAGNNWKLYLEVQVFFNFSSAGIYRSENFHETQQKIKCIALSSQC